MSNSEEAQSDHAAARTIAAAAIKANSVIQEGIVEFADQLTSDNRYQGCNYQQALAGQGVSALPDLVADNIMMPSSSGDVKHDTCAATFVCRRALFQCALTTFHIERQ